MPGDLYLVCQFPSLLLDPVNCHPPGDYPPTERKDIGRPSTIEDVADFVVCEPESFDWIFPHDSFDPQRWSMSILIWLGMWPAA